MKKFIILAILGFWSAITSAETNTEVSKAEIDSAMKDMNSILDQAKALPPGSNGMFVLPSQGEAPMSANIYQRVRIQSENIQTETETTNSN
jgi:hypothetical protein